jgi:hypothetical protein
MKKILVLSLVAVSTASFAVEQFGAGFQVPDNGSASSSIVLSQGAVSIDYVVLNGTTHTWVADWTADVNGTMLFNRPNTSNTLGGDYRFQAVGADFYAACVNNFVCPSGTYASSSDLLTNTSNPNGFIAGSFNAGHVFTLTIIDQAGADIGGIQSWTLGYTAVPEPASMAALGLGVVALIRRRRSK